MPARLIEVALPIPLFRTFTYSVDSDFANPVAPGARVVVPLRKGKEIGICLGPAEHPPAKAKAKPIIDVPDAEPTFSGPMLNVARWISDYYVAPLGVVLRGALPALLTGASTPRPAGKTRRIVTLRRDLPSLIQRERIFKRAPQQRVMFELVESLGGSAPAELLLDQLGCSPSVLKGLVGRGLVTIEEQTVNRDPFAERIVAPPVAHVPTSAQRSAIEAVSAASPGEVFLLHGITGSGKTLVYIDLLRRVVTERGRTAIVLVPEIALTPQTVDRFRAVFGDDVAVLHSALSDGERHDAWRALQRGQKRIAVGARSAIFAPLTNVGAIIVDEEHESSYKQGEAPRYHAREVAIMRGREEGAVVVLGSATPSLESWLNASAGKFTLLTLPERVGGGRLPSIEVVDLRRPQVSPLAASPALPAAPTRRIHAERRAEDATPEPAIIGRIGAGGIQRGNGNGGLRPPSNTRIARTAMAMSDVSRAATSHDESILSPALEEALGERLVRGEQSILLLNRRGYASFVQCRGCGDVATCPDCSITLTYHRTPESLVCHYCLHKQPPSWTCTRCGGSTMRQRGVGTQQVERLVCDRFPRARVARMDVDTTSGKWAHTQILDRVGGGDVDILLGTQMIAKGLDFPNVTLVGVIDADVGINLPDFRASERCFQLLSQVAGRAGRGPKGGRVLIQTRVPGHHAVRCAVAHDYQGFVREEATGREKPVYPPFNRIVNIVFSGTVENTTARLAMRGADWIRALLADRTSAITMIGPAPCPVQRIKTRWRWHVLLKGEQAGEMTRVLRYFAERFPVPKTAQLRATIDRDPVSLL
jgi:primosomal protein N' (replication factor Y)